jgi:hypothetical protein
VHLGDEDVSHFMGKKNERISRHEFHPVDPLLFREPFEARAVQGGFRSGLDPLLQGRLNRLRRYRTSTEKKDAERRAPETDTGLSHVRRHLIGLLGVFTSACAIVGHATAVASIIS